MPSFISHLHLKSGLGDTLPLGDVVTNLRSGVEVDRMSGAAVADNGNAIVMWTESTGSGLSRQVSPWVARRINGEWLAPERIVEPALYSANAFQYGRCVGIGTDGAFYAVVNGSALYSSSTRIYRNSGPGWVAVGGNLNLSALPTHLVPRADGVMTMLLRTSIGGIRSRTLTGDVLGAAIAVGNAGSFASQAVPVYSGTSGEIAVTVTYAVSSSFNNGQTWSVSSDDPLSNLSLWNSWMSRSGDLSIVHRRSSDVNVVSNFTLSRRTADGQWIPGIGIATGSTSDVTGLRVAGDWVVYAVDTASGASGDLYATYARKVTGSTLGPAIELIRDPSINGYRTSVDSILQYADGSYVGEMFTPSGFTYITNDGGEWNPRTVPAGFESGTGSILVLSPDRNYSLGFVLATEDDPETTTLESNLLATVHRRPA